MAQIIPAAPCAREPYGISQHPTDPYVLQPSQRQIRFLHPGYPDEHSVLLVLPALDLPDGIHHGIALDACAILADNRWDGYFTLDREGAQRVPKDNMDMSLTADAYYFHVPGDNEYQIVPTFAEWQFPHNNVPTRWRCDLSFNQINAGRCRLSYQASLLEDAHIVPQNQADEKWFDENGMAIYGPIHGSTNTIKFKVHVHQHFDRKPKFAIVPKYNKWVAQVFTTQTVEAREAIELFHNVPVAIDEQSSCFLLARLAWTIFPLLEAFLKKGVKRRLLRKTENGHELREEDSIGCIQAWLSTRPRSGSPSKRPRRDTTEAQDANDTELEDVGDWTEDQRGRKRTRRSSVYEMPDSQSADERDWHRSGSEVSESVGPKPLENPKTQVSSPSADHQIL